MIIEGSAWVNVAWHLANKWKDLTLQLHLLYNVYSSFYIPPHKYYHIYSYTIALWIHILLRKTRYWYPVLKITVIQFTVSLFSYYMLPHFLVFTFLNTWGRIQIETQYIYCIECIHGWMQSTCGAKFYMLTTCWYKIILLLQISRIF